MRQAEDLSWLLPACDAFQHAAALTVRTLQRPDVWAAVERVAGELEQAGTLTHGLRGACPPPCPTGRPAAQRFSAAAWEIGK